MLQILQGISSQCEGEEHIICTNAKAIIEFIVVILKKVERIAQHNAFRFITLKDKLITCNIAKQWLALQRTQELAKLQQEVVVDFVATCCFHYTSTSPIQSHIVAWSSSLMCKSTCGTNSSVGVADLNAFGVGNDEDDYAKLNSDADEDFDVLAMMTLVLLKRILARQPRIGRRM